MPASTTRCSVRDARRLGGLVPGTLPLRTRKPALSITIPSGPSFADTGICGATWSRSFRLAATLSAYNLILERTMINPINSNFASALHQAPRMDSARPLTDEQQQTIKDALAEFDAGNLSASDAASIVKAFDEAGISRGLPWRRRWPNPDLTRKRWGTWLARLGLSHRGHRLAVVTRPVS